MPALKKPMGAHLVGSVPVQTAEETFRLGMRHLGQHLKRMPDGEVGERDTWIRWQFAKIGASEQLEQLDQPSEYVPVPPFSVRKDVKSADEIQFPDLGYANAAIDSYAVFTRLKGDGVIPDSMRFQVGLPTPLSVAVFYVHPDSRALFEDAYARALQDELSRMLESIPAEELAVQWETVGEFSLLEGLMDNHLGGNLLESLTDRVARLVDSVPLPAEVGLHFCYGDSGHKHFCEPADAGFLAAVAAQVLQKAGRSIAWIHMPVPRDRVDAAYFEPLAALRVPDSTALYLGLVHETGGEEGTRRRIATAAEFVPRFGVATECGFGRRDPATIPDLMDQHAAVAEKYTG